MGEIADSMLDGDMCEGCGEWLGAGDGFPRLCAGCGGGSRAPKRPKFRAMLPGWDAFARERRWLVRASEKNGVPHGEAPAYLVKLEKRGFVRNEIVGPDEQVRFFITDAGRRELARICQK